MRRLALATFLGLMERTVSRCRSIVILEVKVDMGSVDIRAPRGSEISCKGWFQEAALRMLMNNLDREVAANSDELIVYGGTGKAARN